MQQRDSGGGGGKLYVVGVGPGDPLDRTRRAEQAIAASQVIAGYTRYLGWIADLTAGKELIASGMRQEVERCAQALDRAAVGATVALVSSGDAGIYGMAGLILEMMHARKQHVAVEIIPGVTAASAAAARLGAPLMLDFAVISLSDLLTPWANIRKRLEAAAAADFVVALYNPRSSERVAQLQEAVEIFLRYRPATTPVGLGTAVGSPEERMELTDLGHLLSRDVNMRTIVIIGNTATQVLDGWLVTARGYKQMGSAE